MPVCQFRSTPRNSIEHHVRTASRHGNQLSDAQARLAAAESAVRMKAEVACSKAIGKQARIKVGKNAYVIGQVVTAVVSEIDSYFGHWGRVISPKFKIGIDTGEGRVITLELDKLPGQR